MIKNIWYVVSDVSGGDGTIMVGDHIKMLEDGTLLCKEAGGWLTQESATIALDGVSYILDKEWINNRILKLNHEIEYLRSKLK